MDKVFYYVKKFRDVIYIVIALILCLVINSQCSKIGKLDAEISRQENNRKALTDELTEYRDELGRVNAEKHAYVLTQEELRDSIGLLKKKNTEYLSYINSNVGIKDTVKIETVIVKENDGLWDGIIRFGREDSFGKSSRKLSLDIPYGMSSGKLTTGDATFLLDQNIFIEGWLERNTKTDETYIHLRSDYPNIEFNSGLGIVAQNGNDFSRSMRKTKGLGLSIGPSVSFGYDPVNKKFTPLLGVSVVAGLTYTPRFLQW